MLACKFSTDTRSLTLCSLFKFPSCSSGWLRWQTPRLPQWPALQGPDRCCCHGCRCRHRLPPAVHLWPSPPNSPSGSAGTAAAHSHRAATCTLMVAHRVWGRKHAQPHRPTPPQPTAPPTPPHPTAPHCPAPREAPTSMCWLSAEPSSSSDHASSSCCHRSGRCCGSIATAALGVLLGLVVAASTLPSALISALAAAIAATASSSSSSVEDEERTSIPTFLSAWAATSGSSSGTCTAEEQAGRAGAGCCGLPCTA